MVKYTSNEEVWKDVRGYKGYYQVSNLGRVKSLNRTLSNGIRKKGIILKQHKRGLGYLFVVLSKGGEVKNRYAHRLVAEAFVPNSNKHEEVDHKDANKTNNAVSNLEWVSRKENVKRSWEKGLMENQRRAAIKVGRSRSKKVIKMNELGEPLEEYESQTEAARNVGIAQSSISMCCAGKVKSAGGFLWKFSEGVIKV